MMMITYGNVELKVVGEWEEVEILVKFEDVYSAARTTGVENDGVVVVIIIIGIRDDENVVVNVAVLLQWSRTWTQGDN